jgi:hypothetical protein
VRSTAGKAPNGAGSHQEAANGRILTQLPVQVNEREP